MVIGMLFVTNVGEKKCQPRHGCCVDSGRFIITRHHVIERRAKNRTKRLFSTLDRLWQEINQTPQCTASARPLLRCVQIQQCNISERITTQIASITMCRSASITQTTIAPKTWMYQNHFFRGGCIWSKTCSLLGSSETVLRLSLCFISTRDGKSDSITAMCSKCNGANTSTLMRHRTTHGTRWKAEGYKVFDSFTWPTATHVSWYCGHHEPQYTIDGHGASSSCTS